ncbi:MAG: type II secretion system protein, partial [Planctomycetes bacterium]|nr:type II secretion system protein [Planctomycetota bacterium]
MSFEGERVLLRATVLSNIKRAPLRQLHLRLPDGFVVTEVKGSRLEGWDLVGDGTLIRLDLPRWCMGDVRVEVSAERLRSADEVQVEVGPVALREATRARGYLAVVPNRDLMVTAEEVTGLLATAPDRVPEELGTVPEQALCYSVTDGAWARLRIAPVQPLARARSATILHFTQGLLSVGCHVTLGVSRGGVEVVDAVIPAGSADVVVSGSAVKSYERVGEDTWRIRFAGKVYDRTEFDIDFKSIISQARQLVTYPGVVLVDVAQTGVVTVATDPDFEVEEREVTQLAGTMEKGGPGYGEMVDGRALYGYSFQRVPFILSLLTTRLARAETVQARATAAQLTTVVAGRQTAVSRMLYFVENPGRKQYVTVYLGERSLWSTTANGIPVKPALRDDGSVLIPIAEESQQTGTVQVELIFAEPIPSLGGAAATLALRAPKLDIPVEDLRWDVYTPEGYFLFTSTGELLPYDTPEVAGLGALARSFFHVLGGAVSTVLSWLPGALGDVLEGALEFVRDYWWLFGLAGIVGLYLILRYVFHVVIRVSLVGILVLIGIVSLLVAMLMPALSSGRQAAWASNSRSNLKQIGLALFMYSSANDEALPVSTDQLVGYLEGRAAFENPSAPETGYLYVQG